MKVRHAITVVCAMGLVGCQSRAASVLDIFPESGLKSGAGSAVCAFDYEPSGSQWIPGIDEKQVFLASVQGGGWRLGIGKGGQIYSLRGPFGESIPPQRVESPWNDEVWQPVITAEKIIGPIQDYQNANPMMRDATLPLMYFIHQAGIYVQGKGFDGGSVAAPFYSPCLRKRWNPETRTLELVSWMQQARTPCVWKSGVLIYSAYCDLGDGIIEVNQIIHNFGTEALSFLNAPWGGVRHSSLPHTVLSKPDGSWEEVTGLFGWTDIPTRRLDLTGGWEAWVKNAKEEDSPALALVFGTGDPAQLIRWGTAGEPVRDYQVTERIFKANVQPGDSLSVRWYLVSGAFAAVREQAAKVAGQARITSIKFDDVAKQPVWIKEGRVVTEGEGEPWIEMYAFPLKGAVPVFLLENKHTGEQIITADPYALAETEPYPNPLPEDIPIHEIYNNRVVYKQYLPYIGYENLLGYAYLKKTGVDMRQLELPPDAKNIRLHESAQNLWIKE